MWHTAWVGMQSAVQMKVQHPSGGSCSVLAGQQDVAEDLGGEVAALHVHDGTDQLQSITCTPTQGAASADRSAQTLMLMIQPIRKVDIIIVLALGGWSATSHI